MLKQYRFLHTLILGLCYAIIELSTAQAFELNSLEAELKQSESAYNDIVDGTQKAVNWYGTERQRTPLSIVYVHGFSATHKELSPMTEQLAQQLQANVFYTRLRGHGRSSIAMTEATIHDWEKDVTEAYEIGALIGERVLLIGTSTGGTLTTWLSTQPFADKLLANILISPNFGLRSGSTWILQNPIGLWIVKKISGDNRSFKPLNEFHAKFWTESYPLEALVPMLNLLDKFEDTNKARITAPQLVIYSPNDQVIDVEKTLKTIKEFTASEVTQMPFTTSTSPSQHVLVGRASTTENNVQEQVDNMLNIIVPYVQRLATENRHTNVGLLKTN